MGSVLCERLLGAGHRVAVLDNLMYDQTPLFHLCSNPNFSFVFGDARDETVLRPLLRDADVLLPLAAIVGAPACSARPDLAQSVNLEAVSLLNRLRSMHQLVVFPTTNSGYGTKSGQIHCTEDTPLEPISAYGRTKVQAEKVLLESPNTMALRLATVFGVSSRMRLDLLVNHFVYKAVTDGYIIIFEKDFRRNYVHIDDVADCFRHCIENADQMVGRAYNVGLDAANLSKEQVAIKVREHVPKLHIHFAPVGTDPDRRNYLVSNRRLRDAGFEARRTLDEGIGELLKGYRMLGRQQYCNA